ncbi:MAG: hypothetical protein JWQ09_4751 [Segetibacter sp.]|nr:hypothetical protein [Segetibacter sp.]
MTDTKYDLLFTLELLHKYFKDQLCTDFIISPSDKTKEVLDGHKIIAKQYKHQLYVGVQLDSLGKPLPVPEEGMQLTFFLQLNNPLFFNYTNLPFGSPGNNIYYLTNRNSNISNGKNFLSGTYPPYDVTKEYKPGELTTNVSGTVFQASRKSTGVTPPANDVPNAFWKQVDLTSNQNHYMSDTDYLQWLPSMSTYTFDTVQPSANIKVFGYNTSAADYTELVISNFIHFANPVLGFSLNLSQLTPGKYKLNVNGKEQLIYINDELTRKKVFAVVDIFNDSSLPAGYKIMSGDNLINPSPVFSVYFLNRSTIWKYVLPNGVNGVITDNGGIYQFPASASTNVYSIAPIPLNDKPLDIKLKVGTDPLTSVACPTPERLTNYTNAGDTYYCSEIFINY